MQRQLNAFDVTSLVVGSIIGADIYVAAALGAKLVGPVSLLIWLLAGVMAIVIALSFSYSATILPKVGGPYSYIKEVSGPFSGFIVGWSLFLAEWFSLAVFPVAFTRYFTSLFPSSIPYQTILKGAFILVILTTNIIGVKAAGKFNDILTMGKLIPLLLLMIFGIIFISINPDTTLSNFYPFIKGDGGKVGQALVLIFWAYAGFELSTLPADEIENPEKTIPKAIVMGIFIVISFYLITNFVIIGVTDQLTLATSTAPLMTAASNIFSYLPILSLIGSMIIGVGALISVLGADESGTIGTSRLAFAMSTDGLLPKVFSKLHKNYKTPYFGLILICLTAFIASTISTLTELINASVFLLSFTYLSTCISTILLEKKHQEKAQDLKGQKLIPILGIIFSLILMTQVKMKQILISVILLGIGVPIYVFFSPKKEIKEFKDVFMSRGAILKRTYEQGERFLAHPIRHIKWTIYHYTKKNRAWKMK